MIRQVSVLENNSCTVMTRFLGYKDKPIIYF